MIKTQKYKVLISLFIGLIFFLTLKVSAKTISNDNLSSDTLLYLYNVNKHNKQLEQVISETGISIGPINPKWNGIYKHKEKFIIPVFFFKSPDYVNVFRVSIYTYYTRELIESFNVHPVWQNNLFYIYKADLSGLADGVYRIQAKEEIGNTLYRAVEKTVAHKPGKLPQNVYIKIPSDVSSYKILIVKDTHLVLSTPVLTNLNGRKRWNTIVNFLDWAHRNSKNMEFNIPWKLIEPLPDVYDFSEVHKILTFSRRRGFKVYLWFDASRYPYWLSKKISSHKTFIKDALIKHYLTSAVEHFVLESASESSMQGYCFSLNKVKGKELNSESGPILETYARPFNSHFIKLNKFYMDIIKQVRHFDKKRLIIIYDRFTPEKLIWLNHNGVIQGL